MPTSVGNGVGVMVGASTTMAVKAVPQVVVGVGVDEDKMVGLGVGVAVFIALVGVLVGEEDGLGVQGTIVIVGVGLKGAG